MLDIYIWGSAFGLPTIDPECLATLLYMETTLPSDLWRIIPCNDPTVSPLNLLPALSHDGIWTSGYLSIVEYTKLHACCKNIDTGLSPSQQADAIAYCAFLTAKAAPLVDLSLYVSAANWSTTTRPAYSSLLSFPLTWTLPPLIRTAAIERAEHLGLAELDTDFDPNSGLHLTAGRDALPETFRRHLPARTKKSVREGMTPEQAAAIRLLSLVEDCLSVLATLMVCPGDAGPQPRFFRNHKTLSSADCLAYAYVALMVVPPMPRSFLKDYIQVEAPQLATIGDWIGTRVFKTSSPQVPTLLRSTARVADSVVRSIPSVGEHYTDEMRHRREAGIKGLDQRALIMGMGLLVTGAVFGYGLELYKSLQPFGSRTHVWQQQRGGNKLSQFGDVGFILARAMDAYKPEGLPNGDVTASGHLIEVDSELD